MRYIDADALKRNLKENYTFYGFVDLLKDFYVAIDEEPSIDIVRCKECKWRGIPTACPIDNFYAQRWTKDDDFCSYGERKE